MLPGPRPPPVEGSGSEITGAPPSSANFPVPVGAIVVVAISAFSFDTPVSSFSPRSRRARMVLLPVAASAARQRRRHQPVHHAAPDLLQRRKPGGPWEEI